MNKMKCFLLWMLIIVFAGLSLMSACAKEATPAPAPAPAPAPTPTPAPAATPSGEQIVWKFMTRRTYGSETMAEIRRILADTEKATNGRLKIEQFWFGEHPYKPEDLIPSLKAGTMDMIVAEMEKLSGLEPGLNIINLPGLMPALEQRDKYHERLPEVLDPYFRKNWNQFFTPLGYVVNREGIYTNEMLLTKDGLKGQKIRVFGPPTAKLIQLFGGSPQTIGSGEMYAALQRGILDGCLTGMTGATERKIFEVCKYANMWGLYQSDYWVNVNLDSWNKLPADLQDTMMAYWEAEAPKILAVHDFSELLIAEAAMNEYGAVLYATPSDVLDWASAKAREEIWPEFTANMGPLGQQLLELASEIRGEKLY